jgi:hypothetical protein
MSTIHEIEHAVRELSRDDLRTFRAWFAEFEASVWDAQFQDDVTAGSLDALADEAQQDLRDGRCTNLE